MTTGGSAGGGGRVARGGGGGKGFQVLGCSGDEATKREETGAALEGQHACGSCTGGRAGLVGLGEEAVDEGSGTWSALRASSQHDLRRGGGGEERKQAVDATKERSGHFSGGDACLWLCVGLVNGT